jgi:hypothetical protein
MNKESIVLLGLAGLGAIYYLTMRPRQGVQVRGVQDRSSPIYGSRTVTNPVIPYPQLQQFSTKQNIIDIPALLDSGGALFTPSNQGGASGAYADSGLDGSLGGYYSAADAYA